LIDWLKAVYLAQLVPVAAKEQEISKKGQKSNKIRTFDHYCKQKGLQ